MRIELIIWAAIALEAILFSGILPILPDFGASSNLSVQILGVLVGAYSFSSLLTCLPFGFLSDRRNPHLIFIASLAVMTASALFVAVYSSPLGIGLGRLIQGLAGAGVWTAGLVVAGLVAGPAARGRAIAGVFSAATAGEIIGPLISGFLYENYSAASFFWVCTAVGIGLTFAASHIYRRQSDQEDLTLVSQISNQKLRVDLPLPVWGLLSLLVIFVFSAILLVLPIQLSAIYNRSPFEIGLILTGLNLILLAAQLLAGRWSDRRDWPAPIITGFVLVGGSLLVLAIEPVLIITLVALIAAATGNGIAATVTTSLFSKSWERRSPARTGLGTSFGMVNTVWSLGFLLGSVIGGVVLGQSLLQGLFLITGLAFVIASAGIGFILARRRARFPEAPGLIQE
jgi:MFS family permease